MKPVHHHCEAILLDYAAGSLDADCTLLVASYLTLSPAARHFVAGCEEIGGALIEHLCDPAELSEGCLDAILQKIDCNSTAKCAEIEACIQSCLQSSTPLPRPLVRHLATETKPHWRHFFRGMEWLDIGTATGQEKSAKILRCQPGFTLPHHTHQGMEITLILDGAMEDETGRYERGDLSIMDSGTAHTPRADCKDGCLCLSITAEPIRFTGFLTRFLNPFL